MQMTSAPAASQPAPQPTRPILASVLATPWIAEQKVSKGTFGEVAADALQFAFEGTGPMDQRRIVPQGRDAADLLTGSKGAAVERALRGIASTVNGSEARSSFAGISLARSQREFQVNSALSYLEGRTPMSAAFSTEATKLSKLAVHDALAMGAQVGKIAAAQAPGWVNFGPFATRQLLRLAGSSGDSAPARDALLGTFIAGLGAHEPHHTTTPPRMADLVKKSALEWPSKDPAADAAAAKADPFGSLKPVNWLEEATAETLANWPGRLQATGKKMGVATLPALPEPGEPPDDVMMAIMNTQMNGNRFTGEDRAVVDAWAKSTYGVTPRADLDRLQLVGLQLTGMGSYPTHHHAMQTLLAMGGIDPKAPASYGAARDLLQGTTITRVAGQLADRIIETNGVDPGKREQLRTMIRDVGTRIMQDPDDARARMVAIMDLVGLPPEARP